MRRKTRKRAAPQSDASRVERLAKSITGARQRLQRARHRLAAATRPAGNPAWYHPAWRWAAGLLEKRAGKLHTSSNVIGHTISWRQRGGVPTDERCVTVFVKRKLTPAQLKKARESALPRVLRKGNRSIGVDVIQLGRLIRQSTGGDSIGPDGTRSRGTLGSFAIDDATGDTVAITAMHVTGQKRDIPRPGLPRVLMRTPSLKEDNAAPLLGAAILGTLSGIDGCKIALDAGASLDQRINGIGRIRGWRPVLVPGDKGTAVRMFGTVTGLSSGVIEHPMVAMPEFDLDGAILVNIVTHRGDSGAALVDRDNFLLGFLVGQAGNLRIFCPAGLVLRRLGCDIPTN